MTRIATWTQLTPAERVQARELLFARQLDKVRHGIDVPHWWADAIAPLLRWKRKGVFAPWPVNIDEGIQLLARKLTTQEAA